MSRLLAGLLGLGTVGSALAALTALPPPVPAPPGNPTTPEKVALGKRLFFDPVLSQDRTLSCSSCHDPAHAFADPGGRAVSPGVEGRLGRRNAISLINVGDRHALNWNGASPSLETQAMIPPSDHAELNMTPEEVTSRLKADPGYVHAFQAAFGSGPSVQNTARALGSPHDRSQGGDVSALTDQQVRGLDLFFDRPGASTGAPDATARTDGPTTVPRGSSPPTWAAS